MTVRSCVGWEGGGCFAAISAVCSRPCAVAASLPHTARCAATVLPRRPHATLSMTTTSYSRALACLYSACVTRTRKSHDFKDRPVQYYTRQREDSECPQHIYDPPFKRLCLYYDFRSSTYTRRAAACTIPTFITEYVWQPGETL